MFVSYKVSDMERKSEDKMKKLQADMDEQRKQDKDVQDKLSKQVCLLQHILKSLHVRFSTSFWTKSDNGEEVR